MSTSSKFGPRPNAPGSWSMEMEREDQLREGGGDQDGGAHGPGSGDRAADISSRPGPGDKSWAERLRSTLPTSWNKNVLEVVLEKDGRGSFIVSENDCARMLKKIGLDMTPGAQVEGIQICPNGRGIILITLKKEVPIDTYCGHDVFEVTNSGIRVVNVKPVGKREVVVHLRNIHPNTMDEGVVNYLNKFGKVLAKKVVYGVFKEGPLRGFRNGDRSYKMEIKPNVNIGTYHVLDGQKVTVRYPGQLQTCARCHSTARTCVGKGLARRCEELGGKKVDLSDHILKLWSEIGYSPEKVELCADLNEIHEDEENLVQQEGGFFTPRKGAERGDNDNFTGVSIKSFPKDTEETQIIELLLSSGLPVTDLNEISIKPSGMVTIMNLDNLVCKTLIQKLHMQTFFGRKVYCNGVVQLTPEKPLPPSIAPNISHTVVSSSSTQTVNTTPTSSCSISVTMPTLVTSTSSTVVTPPGRQAGCTPSVQIHGMVVDKPPVSKDNNILPVSHTLDNSGMSAFSPADSSLLEIGESDDIQKFLDDNKDNLNDEEMARRYSLSLRSPPPGTLAAEILQKTTSAPNEQPRFFRAKQLISELKEMTTRLSDFESCVSSSSEDDENRSTEGKNDEFKSINEKKRGWKNKRKNSTSPLGSDHFLKRPNKNSSPQTSTK